MKLGKFEQSLLSALDANSRAPNRLLAKKLRRSPQSVGRVIQRLQDAAVVRRFVTVVNTPRLGFGHYKVFVRLQNQSPKQEAQFFSFLARHPFVRWVAKTSGQWDATFSVLARSPSEFVRVYDEVESRFGAFVSEKSTALLVQAPGFPVASVFSAAAPQRQWEYGAGGVRPLDEVDFRILRRLSQDARVPLVRLAAETNVSVDVVRHRLKTLREDGVISAFSVFLGLEELGLEYDSVFFHFRRDVRANFERALAFAKNNGGARHVVLVVGGYDVQLELNVPSHQTLESYVERLRQLFGNSLQRYEVLRVVREYKYDFFPFETYAQFKGSSANV